ELGARHPQRAGRDLATGDLGAAMCLGVRAEVLPRAPGVLGHPGQVALEAIQVEEQRGRRDLVASHGPYITWWARGRSGKPSVRLEPPADGEGHPGGDADLRPERPESRAHDLHPMHSRLEREEGPWRPGRIGGPGATAVDEDLCAQRLDLRL